MKKRIAITFLLILAYYQAVGANSQADFSDVEMVNYEQNGNDIQGTISLKNNTDEDISNVTFMLEYLDMNGTPMDYETYSYKIDIAPGMTKKLNIPAYELSRDYYYYKSRAAYNGKAFKIRYELKEYKTKLNEENERQERYSDFWTIGVLAFALILLGAYFGMYVLVAVMAQRRNRNAALWILLSLFATPIFACLILLVVGKNRKGEF